MCRGWWRALGRRKLPPGAHQPQQGEQVQQEHMARVLGLLDLTLLGTGATLGVGLYVLAGRTALENAGPAVVISFLIAAVASLLAALCYAEFASVVPTAGTAYSYSYVGIGEFPAFVVGWNLLLEYAIGRIYTFGIPGLIAATASVSRGFSNYVDAVTGNRISNWSLEHVPLRARYLAEYPDFLAVGLITLLAVLLAFGAKESSIFNNFCTFMNLLTVMVTVIAGSLKARPALWTIRREDVPAQAGQGGFVPFGVQGVMRGAAQCFYAFVGFDTITACGEEAKNPKRDVPLSILLTIAIIFCSYFATSTVITMMVPYYEQDRNTPFPSAFQKLGMEGAKWVVTVGAMFALCTSLLGAMFPLPRVLLTMAGDGLMFRYFSKIDTRTETSVRSTALAYVMSGSMALLFDLDQLTDMMSIGTLMAYIIVAMSVVQIRYRGERDGVTPDTQSISRRESKERNNQSCSRYLSALVNYHHADHPSELSVWIVTGAQTVYALLTIPGAYLLSQMDDEAGATGLELVSLGVTLTLMVVIATCVYMQPAGGSEATVFKTPLVPWLPYTSVLVNVYLMMKMRVDTWIRFICWLLLGLTLYFSYSIHHSSLAQSTSMSFHPHH